MSKRKKVMRECVLCGKLAMLTSDHIPPRCLFPRGTALVTIPVCLSCNNGTSGDDEYFRAAVALRIECEANPVVNELLPQITRGLLRAGDRGNTGSIISTLRDIDLFTPTGIFAGKGGTYSPDDPRLSRVAARIVRGLYYHEFRERLPDTHGVAAYVVANFKFQPDGLDALRSLVRFALDGKGVVVHRDVFMYTFQKSPDSNSISVWVLTFYRHTPILCFTAERATYRGDRALL